MTAGDLLRKTLNDALAREGADLEWTELETFHLGAAARAADRLELLDAHLKAEQPGPAVLVKISAEMRSLEKAITDHLGRVQIGEGQAKSEQHQRAVNARWDRRRAEREAARRAAGY